MLPVDILKIDRSFVSDLDRPGGDLRIVSMVIALARSLHLDVIAEGIETEAQRDQLVALGCELGQGYLYGRPEPAASMLPA